MKYYKNDYVIVKNNITGFIKTTYSSGDKKYAIVIIEVEQEKLELVLDNVSICPCCGKKKEE